MSNTINHQVCRVIYSIASVAEVLCMSFISLIIVLRSVLSAQYQHLAPTVAQIVFYVPTLQSDFIHHGLILASNDISSGRFDDPKHMDAFGLYVVFGLICGIFAQCPRTAIKYLRKTNICAWKLTPTMWTQWLPKVVDHGLFCIFLFFNAMSTPRLVIFTSRNTVAHWVHSSSQTAMLAILYRDGILYYSFTFIILLMTLLVSRLMVPWKDIDESP
jgi:hypothetical protein